MAGRQNKVGLDYFELDCQMEEKVRLIQAEYGLKGFAVFVKLLQRIYGENGYYCEWTQDSELLFMSENGLDSGCLQLLREIVSACIRRNIFSERLLKEYGILTSSGVQKQYLKATVKREVVDLKKEYLLISVPENRKNVVINSISSYGNSINVVINTQSREEKSREDNIYARVSRFNDFFAAYPKQKNMVAAEKEYMLVLRNDQSLDERELIIAAKNYENAVSILGTEERYIKNPERFLKDGTYLDYLDANYAKPKPPAGKKSGNKFNQFEQHAYDFDELEKELLGN